MELIKFALDGGYVIVGGERIDITNGILSGWRWTAMLDTIVNLIELSMAEEWVEENSLIKVNMVDFCAQGDDDWLKLKDKRSAVALWLAYESFGLFVNPGKFFLDTVRDEFLRRVMDKGIITGYPARSITSICFRNPLSEREAIGADLIRGNFTRWKLLCERLDTHYPGSWFEEKWNQDCRQGVRGTTSEGLYDYLNLPTLLGGIGLDGGYWNDGEVYNNSILEADRLEIEGEGYKEWVQFASTKGVTERTAERFAISTLDLTGKYSIPKWVKYIVADPPIQGYESGLDYTRPGSIAVGLNTRRGAFHNNIRWFKSFIDAKSLAVYKDLETSRVGMKIFDNKVFTPIQYAHSLHLIQKEGISSTLAQMSESPELVWDNYNAQDFLHKPKSWVENFLSGRIKTNPSPRSGWGSDVIGHISNSLLPSAINNFLRRSHPSLSVWDNLLATIDAVIPSILSSLIRVVE